jgi:hypothetical protein
MNLVDMVKHVYGQYGQRYQLNASMILSHISTMQELAFSKNCRPFLKWDEEITLVADSVDATKMSKGAYDFPADCRQVVGVTRKTEAQLLGAYGQVGSIVDYEETTTSTNEVFDAARFNQIKRTFAFAEYPNANDTYRLIYYIRPEILVSQTDNSKVILPREWHDSVLIEGAMLLCDRDNYGGKNKMEIVKTVLEPFWDAMNQTTNEENKNDGSIGAW